MDGWCSKVLPHQTQYNLAHRCFTCLMILNYGRIIVKLRWMSLHRIGVRGRFEWNVESRMSHGCGPACFGPGLDVKSGSVLIFGQLGFTGTKPKAQPVVSWMSACNLVINLSNNSEKAQRIIQRPAWTDPIDWVGRLRPDTYCPYLPYGRYGRCYSTSKLGLDMP